MLRGTPRETFVPPVYVALLKRRNQQGDAVMIRGLDVLKSLMKRPRGLQ